MTLNYDNWLIDTVWVQGTFTATSQGGVISEVGIDVECVCARVERKQQLTEGPDGRTYLTNYVVATASEIGLDTLVWFNEDDAGDKSLARKAVSTESASDKLGNVSLYLSYFQ